MLIWIPMKDYFTSLFLPRHRWYLTAFEKELRNVCNYGGYLPYWDWLLDSGNVKASPVFSPSTTNCAYPSHHVISRNFKPKPFEEQVFPFQFTQPDLYATETFTPAKLDEIMNGFRGDYARFAAHVGGVRAQGMHNAAHLMTRPWLLFVHHTNLDRI
ncbi:hypothetical protein RSOLAG22IIIB_07063 [Rhizoctonia solani]|uniref:Tyrosinase copper-binding domain-containing protein n=1 Tax=Rhizoctonia solani TaxID=456999 RepID=A0A0K6GIQ1_9AGAM|nr:hypothetical protein RSOLAG22IIIB_07063 [Rhizoctonia solani]